MSSAGCFIGLMSGTSLDGVDGVLARCDPPFQVLAHASAPFEAPLRAELQALNTPGPNELHRAALAANALVEVYARVVADLLQQTRMSAHAVRAIGAHGQTVRHQPGLYDGTGYTWQLNQPALLAERCGIDVVADFRSRDVAAGGQGAPLVPAFHQRVFGRPGQHTAVLNLGGIANLSLLGPAGEVQGFDCGPGNLLMDHWCHAHTGQAFDQDGRWAASGRVHPALLAHLMDEPFLKQPPPKSTGRDLFNPVWLNERLRAYAGVPPPDIQATLTAFTAQSSLQALKIHSPSCQQLIVCGGGALNLHLMDQLRGGLTGCEVVESGAAGLPPLQVEAAAFAWLAQQTVNRQAGNWPAVTGARGARVLGAIYPA
ncbi:MAG: anhydro-N-acetylmuramic acid kinase [Limnohabitans sp.]